MNTIVLNTKTGAVTEYDWAFQSLTADRAGSATGLFSLGGDTDDGAPIVAEIATGAALQGSTLRKSLSPVFFAIEGSGTSTLKVHTRGGSYSYPFPVLPGGESRAVPGRGIRESYLALGYSNTDGADFRIDRIETRITESSNRRT